MVNLPANGVLKFYADWCAPCKALAPLVKEVADEIGATVVEINTDEEQELAQQFGIRSIPAIIVLKDGKVADSALGMMKKDKLKALMEKSL